MHTQLDDPRDHGKPLEELVGTDEEKDAEYVRQLKSYDARSADTPRALILMVSHIGGHKFAGNVIVCRFCLLLKSAEVNGDLCRFTRRRVCRCGMGG